jgi:RNA polymerase sigma factor for flagellar operon FliA
MSSGRVDVESKYWEAWKRTKCPLARKSLIEIYTTWVENESKKIYYSLGLRDVDIEDVIQNGRVAFLECMENFKPEIGNDFRRYARIRIKGEIINKLERYSEDQALLKFILKKNRSNGENSMGSEDLFERVAGIIIQHTKDILLYEYVHRVDNCEEKMEWEIGRKEALDIIKNAFSRLTPVEQKVIEYSFFYSMSFTQVAESLGLSKGRVSQVFKEAQRKLNEYFKLRHKFFEFF